MSDQTPDIVERLRWTANDSAGWATDRLTVLDDAADEIERLRAELERVRRYYDDYEGGVS